MYRVENSVLKVLEMIPQTQIWNCINELIAAVNDNLPSEGCERMCKTAEVLLQPTVMANAKFKTASNRGYFNLIMA